MRQDRGSITNPGVQLRDLIRGQADRQQSQVDQVALASVSDVGDGVTVGVLLDGFSAGEIEVNWAVPASPVLEDRVVLATLKGGQSWFAVGVLGGGGTLPAGDHALLSNLTVGDPHTQYLLESAHTKTAHDALGLDHGSLSGKGDDDHTQYHNDTRAGTWHSGLSGAHVTNGDSHDHVGGDGGTIDHGGLAGKSDDDHTQYLLIDGSRAMTGSLNMGVNNVRFDNTAKVRWETAAGTTWWQLYANVSDTMLLQEPDGSTRMRAYSAGDLDWLDATAAVVWQWDQSEGELVAEKKIVAKVPIGGNWQRTSDDTTSWGTSSFTAIDWQATIHSSGGAGNWDDIGGSNPERITVTDAGNYLVVGQIYETIGTGSEIQLQIFVNGTGTVWRIREATNSFGRHQVVGLVNLAADDYITLEAWQNSGSTQTIKATQTTIAVTRVGV